MYINKLYIRAFGKFTHKRIYLGKKFNIIYGENETGKSTIHNFIESMLYGFDDDSKGNEQYKKYKPWNSDLYKGSITIDGFDGKKYLVTRDFLLGTTQVFDKDLDENNAPIPVDEEIGCPGEYFFNINNVAYRNTISIKQLGNKTEQELSMELKNKIINLSNSRDESISIDRILSSINSIKDEAGSEDNPKTLLGQYALRLNELKKAKENTINANRQVMFLAMEKKKISSKIQETDMLISRLNDELSTYELSVEKDKYLKAIPVKKELDEINEILGKYNDEDAAENFSKNDFDESSRIYSSLVPMYNDKHNLRNKRDEAESSLDDLKNDLSNRITEDFNLDKINSDYKLYVDNKTKINDMLYKIKTGMESLESFNADEINKFMDDFNTLKEINSKQEIAKILLNDKNYELMTKFAKSSSIKSFFNTLFGIVFLSLTGLALYGGYYYGMAEYYAGSALLIPSFIMFSYASKCRKRTFGARKEIESIECQKACYIRNTEKLQLEADEIIKNSGSTSAEEFYSMYEGKKTQKTVMEEKLKLLECDKKVLSGLQEANEQLEKNLKNMFFTFDMNEVTEENYQKVIDIYNRKDSVKENITVMIKSIEDLNLSLSKIDKEISFEEKRLNMILNSNNMKSIDEFKIRVERFEYIKELKDKKAHCENFLSTVLGSQSFEELKQKTEKLNIYDIKEIDKKQHQLSIFKKIEEKNKLLIDINNLDKEIEHIESGVRNLAEVEEEIEFYEDKKSLFKEKIEVADIAAKKILEISDSIKGDFMPLLRKSISENFAYITGGKYREVNIDENMSITVKESDDDSRNIELDNLSGGTLDQLFLSLRISLSNILSGNQNIPVILDDSFVQYDSGRLKKSIEMLFRESERRQIILFTCQEREIEYAKQLKIKFNYIKL